MPQNLAADGATVGGKTGRSFAYLTCRHRDWRKAHPAASVILERAP